MLDNGNKILYNTKNIKAHEEKTETGSRRPAIPKPRAAFIKKTPRQKAFFYPHTQENQ